MDFITHSFWSRPQRISTLDNRRRHFLSPCLCLSSPSFFCHITANEISATDPKCRFFCKHEQKIQPDTCSSLTFLFRVCFHHMYAYLQYMVARLSIPKYIETYTDLISVGPTCALSIFLPLFSADMASHRVSLSFMGVPLPSFPAITRLFSPRAAVPRDHQQCSCPDRGPQRTRKWPQFL